MGKKEKYGVGVFGIGWVAHEHIKGYINNPKSIRTCSDISIVAINNDIINFCGIYPRSYLSIIMNGTTLN